MKPVTRRIFIYEDTCGGGCRDPLPLQLRGEGLAMLNALCEDFAAIEGVELVTTLDERIEPGSLPLDPLPIHSPAELDEKFDALAVKCDLCLILAPELGGRLSRLSRRVVSLGGRLHGGDIELIETASDKLRLWEYLEEAGIPALPCKKLNPGRISRQAVVLKPRFGAGSIEISTLKPGDPEQTGQEELVVTPLLDGMAVSVLCVAGGGRIVALQPCRQRLSDDGGFSYLGGSLPLPARDLSERARKLSLDAVGSFPKARGFIGVDLILGERPGNDRVVEINPRPTTSYCALRRRSSLNLARLSLELLDGVEPGSPTWPAEEEFYDSEGTTEEVRTMVRDVEAVT